MSYCAFIKIRALTGSFAKRDFLLPERTSFGLSQNHFNLVRHLPIEYHQDTITDYGNILQLPSIFQKYELLCNRAALQTKQSEANIRLDIHSRTRIPNSAASPRPRFRFRFIRPPLQLYLFNTFLSASSFSRLSVAASPTIYPRPLRRQLQLWRPMRTVFLDLPRRELVARKPEAREP